MISHSLQTRNSSVSYTHLTDKDKKLSAAEIKAAKTIDVSGLGISNLKGIERFTYATDLFAANNKLTSVNITKNTRVAYLNLSNNSLAGTLNLSKCTNLRVVKYGSNKPVSYTHLDVYKRQLLADSSADLAERNEICRIFPGEKIQKTSPESCSCIQSDGASGTHGDSAVPRRTG